MPFPPLFSWIWPLFLATLLATASVSAVPTKIGKGYKLVSVEETPDGGILGLLQVKKKNNVYGPDIPYLQLYVKHETDSRLRVHITDAEQPRWEVPYDIIPREKPAELKKSQFFARKAQNSIPLASSSSYGSSSELIFSYKADPFTFSVKRKSTGKTLFDSNYNTLVFKDQYLEISTVLPKNASLYGLGESSRVHGHRLYPNDPPYTLFTTDVAAINLNTDLYGSHPVYMDLRNDGGGAFAHAVLLMNSNGMDVFYRGDSLTYKIIGGVLDYYFFSGPSPLEVVDQYTAFIGRPAPMPYWSFGFHQCRWGYHNLSVVEDVVENYKKAKIPLDVIWNDDDHMDGHKDFTLNPVTYPRTKLLAFLEKIHAEGMKYIVINDPGIGVNNSYGTFVRAMEQDLFIKYNGQPFLAQVWPGAVYFPDFLNPKTTAWWVDEIKRFHELVPIDGLWIDMNEVSNFCNGLCTIPKGKICPSGYGPGWVCCLDCKNITQTKWDDPPYKINASGIQALPGYKTIATSATHYNGVREYDAHSIYGLTEAMATHKGLQGIAGKRPFILSRATFVSSGHYAAHWTGDNQGTWEDLKFSISTMLDFGLFGVPMVGSDICGFYPDWALKDPRKAEELCNRWIELGAFYPFSRDHANFYSPRQELYQWESVAESARNALGLRYKLLPYFYTLSYEAHISGAPIARPLFYSFPENTMLYGLSTQFLLGSSVMVSPVLDPNVSTVKALFPAGSWYSLFDMTKVVDSKVTHNVTLDAPIHVINVHVYQNTILPMQQGGMISKQARMTPFSLIIAFPLGAAEGQAKGKLFLDNDELPEMKLASGSASYIEFYATVSNKTVKVWSSVQEGEFALDKGWTIERVAVLGLDAVQVNSALAVEVEGNQAVDVSKAEFSQALHNSVVKVQEEGDEKTSMMVEVKGLNLLVGKKFTMSWHMGV